MGRKAKPRIWRGWYVTEAGGQGIHKLCPVSDGAKEAQKQLKDYLEDRVYEQRKARDAGLADPASPYTVAQLAAEFVRWKQTTKKAETADFHRKNLFRLVEWYGDQEARKLKLAHGLEYLARLKEDGLGNTTVNHHVRSAKAVLNFAVEGEVLARNPWRKVDLLPERRRKRVVTEEEFQRLLKACDGAIAYRGVVSREDNSGLMRDILQVLRYTAMRPGELRGLRWDHLRLDDDLIVIPAEEQKTGTTAKHPEDRLIPLLPESKAIFLSRRQKYGRQPLVFPSVVGKKWTMSQFSRRFARLRNRAGLTAPDHNGERLVLYSLRHSRLTEAGTVEDWPLYTLMRFAGHTTAQMTRRYVHPDETDLRRAALEGQRKRLGLPEVKQDTP